LTGVLIEKRAYDIAFQPQLEQLKRLHFRYDIDNPPILVRADIRGRKSEFGVLREPSLNAKWEEGILQYLTGLIPYTLVYTVVIDKKTHLQKYPAETFEAYRYCLQVLRWRVRGFLHGAKEQADVVVEARNRNDNKELKDAYVELRTHDLRKFGKAQVMFSCRVGHTGRKK
jgi:hypothetical protein